MKDIEKDLKIYQIKKNRTKRLFDEYYYKSGSYSNYNKAHNDELNYFNYLLETYPNIKKEFIKKANDAIKNLNNGIRR